MDSKWGNDSPHIPRSASVRLAEFLEQIPAATLPAPVIGNNWEPEDELYTPKISDKSPVLKVETALVGPRTPEQQPQSHKKEQPTPTVLDLEDNPWS
jgi:hypothetical protein